ncbi:MAG: ABC transporter substrate-binding protein [Anaerolineae bacterium]|nr:ABC transporter substrate-binding protein [Anaerolineae bacterium]
MMLGKKSIWNHFFCIWLLIFLSACAPIKTNPESIVFMAGYKPQANLPFVGVYVAQANGYFDEEHVEVTIQHSAGRGEHLQLLVAGSVDITTQDAAVLLQRCAEPGLPLVSIGLIGQRGQQAFIAITGSNIKSIDDWRGHKIGFKGTPPPDLLAILDQAGIHKDDIELINVGFDPRVLTEGLVDIYPVYKSNEPYLLNAWGYTLLQWDADQFGIPTMGLTYVTTPDVIEQKSAALTSFMRAVIRGISFAEQNPEMAVDIVMQYTGPEADRDHMLFMLETELEDAHSALTDKFGLGWQSKAQWQDLLDTLLHYDAISGPVDIDTVFDNQFLPGKE